VDLPPADRGSRWQLLRAAISSGEDLGYTIGSYEITQSDEQGKRVASTGKYVTIWRKQPDGSWKVVFDSGVPDSPPQPAAKPDA
jgi:ketosteroid isomerase-like protein